MKPITLLAGLLALPAAPSADVSLFHGTPGGPGNVGVHDDTGVAVAQFPAELQGVVLLPIDFVGRSELEELLPDRPRLRLDVPGASRLVLPGGAGSLYHYRRDLAPSGAVFGWMRVDGDGVASSLWEAAGTGPTSDVNPLIPRVAVAPDGLAFLFATTLGAGGDLYEIDLATGAATLRTSLLPPREFSVAGLFLRADWGIGAGPGGVLRFDRLPGAEATAVPFPGSPTWFSGEVAVSGDGLVAATSAGTDPMLAHVFTFAGAGPALQVTATPARISAAGYLPEYLDGPYLALSQDGSSCAWITEGVAREAFLADGVSPLVPSTFQLTGDATYLDTLDEIGVLFFVPGALILAVGEAGATPQAGIENIDLYRATTGGGGSPAIQNLSLSSGVSTPPFFAKSAIQPDSLHRLPGTDRILVLDRDAGSGRLLLVDTTASAPLELLLEAKSLDLLEPVASRLALAIRRANTGATRDLFVLDLLAPAGLISLASLPDVFEFERPAARSDGWLAFVVRDALGGGEYLARLHLPTLVGRLLARFSVTYGPAMTWTPAGNLLFSVDVPAVASFFFGWPLAPVLLPVADAPAAGFVLPAN